MQISTQEYQLDHEQPIQTVEMPEASVVLGMQLVSGKPTLFVQIRAKYNKKDREVFIMKTGETIPKSGLDYVGSYQKNKKAFHVFIN